MIFNIILHTVADSHSILFMSWWGWISNEKFSHDYPMIFTGASSLVIYKFHKFTAISFFILQIPTLRNLMTSLPRSWSCLIAKVMCKIMVPSTCCSWLPVVTMSNSLSSLKKNQTDFKGYLIYQNIWPIHWKIRFYTKLKFHVFLDLRAPKCFCEMPPGETSLATTENHTTKIDVPSNL